LTQAGIGTVRMRATDTRLGREVNAFDARYVPSGHLLFVRDGSLIAARFDPQRMEVTGGEVPVAYGLPKDTLESGYTVSSVETRPNNLGQPNCGVLAETPLSFSVMPTAACGQWTATSSSPGFLQITSGGNGTGQGTVTYQLLNNTRTLTQHLAIAVSTSTTSTSFPVTQTGSGDNEVFRQVYALYEQFLGRDPDTGGFQFWTGGGGAALGQMADSFLTSPEAFNSDFAVMAAYQAATGAAPSFGQFNAAVVEARPGAQSIAGLFNSLIQSGFNANTLYQNLLSRAPTPRRPIARTEPANPPSPFSAPNNEFQNTGTFHTDHTNILYVTMLYYLTFLRNPDQAGFQFWMGVANGGGPGLLFQGAAGFATRIRMMGPGTPNQGFIGSPEFQGLFANQPGGGWRRGVQQPRERRVKSRGRAGRRSGPAPVRCCMRIV
jgi:hypothetical protein